MPPNYHLVISSLFHLPFSLERFPGNAWSGVRILLAHANALSSQTSPTYRMARHDIKYANMIWLTSFSLRNQSFLLSVYIQGGDLHRRWAYYYTGSSEAPRAARVLFGGGKLFALSFLGKYAFGLACVICLRFLLGDF